MENIKKPNKLIVLRKKLPALGGVRKNYIRKANCLNITLVHLVDALEKFEKDIEIPKNKKFMLNEIKKDFLKIAKYEKLKKIDFYFLCSSIVQKYNI